MSDLFSLDLRGRVVWVTLTRPKSLTRLIGKLKAMDMILTGRMIDAAEALQANLVARVFAKAELLEKSLQAATFIAIHGKIAAMAARESVERALESPLSKGILFERRSFHAVFATADQTKSMAAFLAKRPPSFTGR